MRHLFAFLRNRAALTVKVAALASIVGLTGCAGTLSGIGGETTFKCKAPDGVQCQSVSGTYANSRVGNLPSQQPSSKSASPRSTADAADAPSDGFRKTAAASAGGSKAAFAVTESATPLGA